MMGGRSGPRRRRRSASRRSSSPAPTASRRSTSAAGCCWSGCRTRSPTSCPMPPTCCRSRTRARSPRRSRRSSHATRWRPRRRPDASRSRSPARRRPERAGGGVPEPGEARAERAGRTRARDRPPETLLERFRPGVAAEQWSAREWPDGRRGHAAARRLAPAPLPALQQRRAGRRALGLCGRRRAGAGRDPGAAGRRGDARPVGGGNSGAAAVAGAAAGRVARRGQAGRGRERLGVARGRRRHALGGPVPRRVLGRLPEPLDAGVLDAMADGSTYWLVMRDVSDSLLGDERRLSREESRGVLEAAAAMHDALLGRARAVAGRVRRPARDLRPGDLGARARRARPAAQAGAGGLGRVLRRGRRRRGGRGAAAAHRPGAAGRAAHPPRHAP